MWRRVTYGQPWLIVYLFLICWPVCWVCIYVSDNGVNKDMIEWKESGNILSSLHHYSVKVEFCRIRTRHMVLNRGFQQVASINYVHQVNQDVHWIGYTGKMKLAQYTQSFAEPIRNQDSTTLIRLLAARNKTARGLSDTIGNVDVRYVSGSYPWRHLESEAMENE